MLSREGTKMSRLTPLLHQALYAELWGNGQACPAVPQQHKTFRGARRFCSGRVTSVTHMHAPGVRHLLTAEGAVRPRRPAAIYPDPIRGGEDVLVLCSVYNPDDTPHATNTRALLEKLLTPAMEAEKPLYGFEQVCKSLERSSLIILETTRHGGREAAVRLRAGVQSFLQGQPKNPENNPLWRPRSRCTASSRCAQYPKILRSNILERNCDGG